MHEALTRKTRVAGTLALWLGLVTGWMSGDPTPVLAQAALAENATVNLLHDRVNTFLNGLADRTTARRAIEQMVEGGPLERQPNTTKLIEQVEQFSSRFGVHLESERVAARIVGRDLVLLTYLYKTDQFPVVWRFAFYRPPARSVEPSSWRVVSLSFDTNYQQLYDPPSSTSAPRTGP